MCIASISVYNTVFIHICIVHTQSQKSAVAVKILNESSSECFDWKQGRDKLWRSRGLAHQFNINLTPLFMWLTDNLYMYHYPQLQIVITSFTEIFNESMKSHYMTTVNKTYISIQWL